MNEIDISINNLNRLCVINISCIIYSISNQTDVFRNQCYPYFIHINNHQSGHMLGGGGGGGGQDALVYRPWPSQNVEQTLTKMCSS